MPDQVWEYGIVGVIAVMVVKEAFALLKARNDVPAREERWKEISKAAAQVDAIYKMHDVKGRDGIPVWYVRESLEDAINELARSLGS